MLSSIISKAIQIVSLYLLMILSVNANDAWNKIAVKIESEDLKDISSVNDSVIVAVGYLGYITISTDTGRNWKTVHGAYYNDDLKAVSYSGDMIYTAGKKGTLIQSDDFGSTWNNINLNTTQTLNSIDFSNGNGILVGDSNTIYISKDHGFTWDKVNPPVNCNLKHVDLLNNNIAIAVGDSGVILKTTDSGINWIQINTDIRKNLTCISINPNGNIIVGGEDNAILKSTNQGESYETTGKEINTYSITSLTYISDDTVIGSSVDQNGISYQFYSLDGLNSIIINIPWWYHSSSTYNNKSGKVYLCGQSGCVVEINILSHLPENNNDFKGFRNKINGADYHKNINDLSGY